MIISEEHSSWKAAKVGAYSKVHNLLDRDLIFVVLLFTARVNYK